MSFKSYSSKRNAVRGVQAFAKANGLELTEAQVAELVYQDKPAGSEADMEVEAKWGFNEESVQKLAPVVETAAHPLCKDGALITTAAPVAEQDQEEPDYAPVASAGMFGGMAATLGAVAEQNPPVTEAAKAASRNSYTIEKDRPEQNGIKRPSAGGLCRAVWDHCDHLRELNGGVVPTAKQIKESAPDKGWNPTNAMIEFYQWRKFNGIVGRAKKAEAAK